MVDRASQGEQKVIGYLFIYSSSINPTQLVDLLFGGYSASASYDALFNLRRDELPEAFFHTSSLDLPSVGRETFFEVTMISSRLSDSGQVSGSSKDNALPSLRPYGPMFQELDVQIRAH
jgi:hypothetical protein